MPTGKSIFLKSAKLEKIFTGSPCVLVEKLQVLRNRLESELGEAVPVEPMKSILKAPGTKRLKLTYDNLLSNVAFNFNLRRYTARRRRRSTRAPSPRATPPPQPPAPSTRRCTTPRRTSTSSATTGTSSPTPGSTSIGRGWTPRPRDSQPPRRKTSSPWGRRTLRASGRAWQVLLAT